MLNLFHGIFLNFYQIRIHQAGMIGSNKKWIKLDSRDS